MRLALIGYGKMGKEIEKIAIERGHEISLKITSQNKNFTHELLSSTDVAIEFSTPESAKNNIKKCINAGVPVAIGTTGWYEYYSEIEDLVHQKNGAILPTTNFSVGVNIFFEINKKLASLMNYQPQYDIEVEEIHHIQKKDAPSGTGITIAEGILNEINRKQKWVNSKAIYSDDLSLISKRIDEVPGTHSVKYISEIDDIEIIHTAHNRKGFALGAVLAAEFLHQKKGVFSMKDVLGL